MLSSIGRILWALTRFGAGAGLALVGLGLFRQDPRLPAALAHLAAQPPFGGLWWALVALAGGVALMLHALPSPWKTDRLADRGRSAVAPPRSPDPDPAPAVPRRTFDAAPEPVPPPVVPPSVVPPPVVPSPAVPPPVVAAPPAPAHPASAPVFRSRPAPRRPPRALRIQPAVPGGKP